MKGQIKKTILLKITTIDNKENEESTATIM